MSIESAYKGRTIIQPATQLFAEIVEMYRNNRENYDKLLEKAKHMVEFDVENENATDSSSNRASDGVESVLPSRCGNHIIPEKLLLSIRQFYGNGMRFDETVFRLLEERSGTKVDKTIKNILQSNMFCRSDGLNFLPEMPTFGIPSLLRNRKLVYPSTVMVVFFPRFFSTRFNAR